MDNEKLRIKRIFGGYALEDDLRSPLVLPQEKITRMRKKALIRGRGKKAEMMVGMQDGGISFISIEKC